MFQEVEMFPFPETFKKTEMSVGRDALKEIQVSDGLPD